MDFDRIAFDFGVCVQNGADVTQECLTSLLAARGSNHRSLSPIEATVSAAAR